MTLETYKARHSEIELTPDEIETALKKAHSKRFHGSMDNTIVLTDLEREQALFDARRAKKADITIRSHWNKVHAPVKYPVFNAEQLRAYVLEKFRIQNGGEEYVLDDYNSRIFDALCLYFSGDERFNELKSGNREFSLRKGIRLTGPVGCGKSEMMKMFTSNSFFSYYMKSCRDISYEFVDNGFHAIIKYSGLYNGAKNKFGHQKYGICFDDLGTDEEKKYFGNKANTLGEILLNRYDHIHEKSVTHVTDNLNPDDIQEMYGIRLRSRMRQMFNSFVFDKNAPDRRK